MFVRKRLACSFCGKTAAEVAKLAAGPKVFICDGCVAEASRIMGDLSVGARTPIVSTPGLWLRLRAWLQRCERVSAA